MTGEKMELLAAIAAAGTQGRVDYEQAKAANAAAQQQALQAAVAQAAGMPLPGGFQDQLNATISRPYEMSNAHLAANAAAQETWFNHSKWNQGIFQGNLDKLREALIAQTLAEQAAGGGSGGGGGGGGGGGDDVAFDWYDNLKDTFGTAAIGKAAIAEEAKSLYNWSETKVSPHEFAADYAEREHGVPKAVGMSWYKQPKDDAKDEAFAREALGKAKTIPKLKKFIKQTRSVQKSMPGSQKYYGVPLRQEAKRRLQAKKRRRRRG